MNDSLLDRRVRHLAVLACLATIACANAAPCPPRDDPGKVFLLKFPDEDYGAECSENGATRSGYISKDGSDFDWGKYAPASGTNFDGYRRDYFCWPLFSKQVRDSGFWDLPKSSMESSPVQDGFCKLTGTRNGATVTQLVDMRAATANRAIQQLAFDVSIGIPSICAETLSPPAPSTQR